MPRSAAAMLDLSALPAAARREVRDFYQFVLARRGRVKKSVSAPVKGYCFSDLCGGISWNGDAVAAQRELRDEW